MLGKKILVVDDDEDILNQLKTYLLEDRYQFVQAHDGREAEDILDTYNISLVVTDEEMPNIKGVELFHWVESKKDIPVVLMSASKGEKDIKYFHEEGIHYFIPKPIKKYDLLDLLDSLFSKNPPQEVYLQKENCYCPIEIDEFLNGKEFNIPIFIKLSDDKYIKIANNTDALTEERVLKFKEKGISNFYLVKTDYNKSVQQTYKKVETLLQRKNEIPQEMRKQFVLRAGKILIEKAYVDELNRENFDMVSNFVSETLDDVSGNKEVMSLLDSLNSISDNFYAHCLGVSAYGVMLAKALGWENESTLKILSLGGIFHDVGKRDIPLEILEKKSEELTDDDRTTLENHPIHGADIVSNLKFFPQEVAQIIMQHHENCRGTGFPFKLKKDFIYPPARIIFIADLFCKYTIERADVEKLGVTDALNKIETDYKGMYDTKFFDVFKSLF